MLIKNNLIHVFLFTMILLLSVTLYFVYTSNQSGHGQNDHALSRSLNSEKHIDTLVMELKNSISMLMNRQQQLQENYEAVQHELSTLTYNAANITDDLSYTDTTSRELKSSEQIDQEEINFTNEENDLVQFDTLKDNVLQEEYDSNWASEMDTSLANVEQRFKELNIDSIAITNKDCRSNACLVEFAYSGNIDPSILNSVLAAEGTSEVILKHVSEGDNNSTIAIYKR